MSAVVEIAQAAWGDRAPEWIMALAMECDASSQSAVARVMGRSPSLINQVLRNTYRGDMDATQRLFAGHFMKATLPCPALGQIPTHICQGWRAKSRKYSNASAERVRMFRACRLCPRNTAKGEGGNG